MGGSSSSTTTTSNPPTWAKPLFELSGQEGLNLYKSGVGGNTYLGSTVAPLSGTTMQGVNQLAGAGANWNTAQSRPLFQGIGAQSVSDPFVGKIAGAADRLSGPTSAQANLQDMASGKWLREGNPYFNARLEDQLADTAAQTRSLMSGSGRYGSDVSNRVLADRLGNLRTQALAEDWDRNLQAQLAATGQIDASKIGYAGTQGNLYGAAGNLRGAGLDRATTAASAMAGLDQQSFANRLAGADATLKAGGILDDQAQKLLSDEVAKFYALDNQDWTRLGMLQGAAAGAAGPYGTQLSTSRQSGSPLQALGAVGSLMRGMK